MINAVVDTNVLVSGAITDQSSSANKRVMDALFSGRFTLVLSPATMDEIKRVLLQPSIREKHGQTERVACTGSGRQR